MTQCCVPFCRNKSRKAYGEYMCGPHHRTAPKHLKSRRNKVGRALARRGEWDFKRSVYLTPRAVRLDGKLWKRIKDAVISNASPI